MTVQNLKKFDELCKGLVSLRRELHRQPELAFHEVDTAKIIMRELSRLRIPYQYKGEGHGIIGFLKFKDNAPWVALRAELDGLPGNEKTGLRFTSERDNAMHACGHDAHMTMVIGAAEMLSADPPDINVKLIFQPAEESGGGARTMIEDKALDDVSAVFGGHVTHHYKVGEIMVNDGVITAQSDRFNILICGEGGHGARPHEAIDAVVIASALINTIQTIVSREIDPLHPSVITVGMLNAGSAPNVIAEQASMSGSIRSTLPQTRERLHEGLRRICKAYEALYCARIKLGIEHGYPPVVNTADEANLARKAACAISSGMGLRVSDYPSMGSEDFSFYLQEKPGCYVRFGARPEGIDYIPLHSAQFDINEDVLGVGTAFFDQLVRESANFYQAKTGA